VFHLKFFVKPLCFLFISLACFLFFSLSHLIYFQVLDKFVGGSEEKIRALFADAEKEQLEMGDNSMLHIIIFDEMDAIMKTRGSTGDSTGVNDSVVNQLLSKIDGVDALNNILIIGTLCWWCTLFVYF